MKAIGNIQLIWRPAKGLSRIPIGTLKKNETDGVRFNYNLNGINAAQELGFIHYEGFPDVKKIYTDNVLQTFGQRLLKTERTDFKEFYDFWNVDLSKVKSKFYMLAFTQGLLPTDNFEFLADFNPVKNLTFITEITNLNESKIISNIISKGDVLRYELEPENKFDKNAVKVFKNDLYLGHIKLIHCNVFHKTKKIFKIQVHGIEKNGVLKRVFLKISL